MNLSAHKAHAPVPLSPWREGRGEGKRRLAFGLFAALLLASCGWSSDGRDRLEELYPTPAPAQEDGGTGAADAGAGLCSGYGGHWATRLVQKGEISPLGTPWQITVIDLFLAQKSTSGTSMELRFCNQDVTIVASGQPTQLGKAQVPDALKSALYQAPFSVPLPSDGTFHATDLVWLWALKDLVNPLTDPLPNKNNYVGDPRVMDQDTDGHPGATLKILSPMGDRYMVRRAVLTFGTGSLTLDNQWLTGALTSRIDESALGATSSVLLTPAPITVKAEGTVYEFRCVDATYTCEALSLEHQALFADAP